MHTDPDAKTLCRAGAISALTVGIGYLAIIALYVPMGAPPSGAQARLSYIAAHTPAWWAILWLSVLTDLLFLPLFLSLYAVLKQVSRHAMLVAVVCVSLFVVLDLAITWTNYAALINLAARYAKAAGESERMALVVAAEYPCAVLESTLLFVYNTLTLAIGILAAGLCMRKSAFRGATAYLGLATGILGIVSVFGPLLVSALSTAIILTSLLTTIWAILAGIRLWSLGRA